MRGPTLMAGYLGLPEETRRVLPDDGWLRTGDLVSLRDTGEVVHHGRTARRRPQRGRRPPGTPVRALSTGRST